MINKVIKKHSAKSINKKLKEIETPRNLEDLNSSLAKFKEEIEIMKKDMEEFKEDMKKEAEELKNKKYI